VIVTSDQEEAVENDFEYAMKPKISTEDILKEAKFENDGHSWIAAEIKVRLNMAATVTFMVSLDTISLPYLP
jgi:hypothetical protein